jgi:hypothetical protein
MNTTTTELDNSIYIANVMFPDESCDEVIDIFENKSKLFPENHFLKNADGLYRKDKACFLDDFEICLYSDIGNFGLVSDINNYLNEALEEYCNHFESVRRISLRSTRQKLQKTQKGGGYHNWHSEQENIDSAVRVLTWSIYLNDVAEGGETEFLYQSKRIKARKGKILIFPSAFTHVHRGNPPLSGDKYILTGWWNIF